MSGNRAYIFPILLMITIFFVSGTSRLATPDIGFSISKDKLAHFLVFGLIATSILRTSAFSKMKLPQIIFAAVITSAYGGFDEFRQSFTPNRSVEFDDWIADTAGAIVAVIVYSKWKFYRDILEWKREKTKGRTSQED
ncbi:MAG: VanZ family protein [Opitutaceae bacterium]